MKESEAWKILAEEHDAGRTHTPFLCISLANCAGHIWPNERVAAIPFDVRRGMVSRIEESIGHNGSAYEGDPESRVEERDARVLACLLFSEQAKEEAR